jgi:hypothetical protein
MTLMSELHSRSHRYKMSKALSMMSRLVRWERFANDCELIARVEVHSDLELHRLLEDCSDFWEFDTDTGVLHRQNQIGDDVRMEIDVRALLADDVYRVLGQTEPIF